MLTKLEFYTESCLMCFYNDNNSGMSEPKCNHPLLQNTRLSTRENILDYQKVPDDCPARPYNYIPNNYRTIF